MKIGVIAALWDEISPFISAMEVGTTSTKAMLTVYEGICSGVEVAAVMCGICKVNAAIAAQVLIDSYAVTHIVFTGTAGGVRKGINVGDTVVVTSSVYRDVVPDVFTAYHPNFESAFFQSDPVLTDCVRTAVSRGKIAHPVHFGLAATGETFVEGDDWDIIKNAFGDECLCVEMETAGAAHVCKVFCVPYIAFRSISDNHEVEGFGTFEQNLPMAAKRSVDVLLAMLEELVG